MKLRTLLVVCILVFVVGSGCVTAQLTPAPQGPPESHDSKPTTENEPVSPIPPETEHLSLTATPTQQASLAKDSTVTPTLTLPASPFSQLADQAELTLTLSLETDNFGLGEEVSVTLQLQNIGTESVLVHTRMGMGDPALPKSMRDIVFEITKPSGKELPFRIFADLAASQPSDFRTLKPGESFQLSYYLDVAYSFDLPGRYRIKAIYNNQFEPETGETAWKGEITSNTMTFTIEP